MNGNPLRLDSHELSLSLAIQPDRSGFLLGGGSNLYCFDSQGKQVWRVRTPGAVYGVNTNGRLAVAGLGDGTIRWYRITDGREVLSLFPHPDRRRWVLWTPSGYYDASPGGEDFIGWHVNHGKDRAADFFPNSRFRLAYYRPDVIDRVLVTMDEAEALRQANEQAGRKPAETISVRDKLPPVVAIGAPADGAEVSSAFVKVHYAARSQEALTRLKVLVDGRPVAIEGRSIKPIPIKVEPPSMASSTWRTGVSQPASTASTTR